MATISLLLEQGLAAVKPLGISKDREKLIACAERLHLDCDMEPLRRAGAAVEIDEFTTVCIREVDYLDD